MEIKVLQERVAKTEEKIAKKEALIDKNEKLIEKKIGLLSKKYSIEYAGEVIRPEDEAMKHLQKNEAYEAFWLTIDIRDLRQRITEIPKEISEIKKQLGRYNTQLETELAKERTWINEVPQVLKDVEADIIKRWDEWDKERQETLTRKYKELGYSEFIHKYKYTTYEFIRTPFEDLHKKNEKDARLEVLDLVNRVKAITGEITDWANLRLEQGNNYSIVLNGTVKGKMGKARVESIEAGGYNIQKWHIRTLVHSI